MVRHVRYSRWQSTPARPPQSLWLPVIHHSGRAKLLLSRTRCPNPQRNCPEHNPSSNRRATDATDPYNLCASVLKKLTRDPASTDLGLESPSYAHSCPFVVQIAPLRLSVSIRTTNSCFLCLTQRFHTASCTSCFVLAFCAARRAVIAVCPFAVS